MRSAFTIWRAHRDHPTREGWLYISVHSNHFFAALCELIGRPELGRDPRCATMRSRAEHTAELVSEVRSALAARTAHEWEELFGERVPCAAVRPIEDMFDHPTCSPRISSRPSIIRK